MHVIDAINATMSVARKVVNMRFYDTFNASNALSKQLIVVKPDLIVESFVVR